MRAYKYLDERYGLKDIQERRVKVSSFKDMNDPFELIGCRWDDASAEAEVRSQTEQFGVMCLSRNCTSPLLWAHYANKHKGLCLGFDIPDGPGLVNPVIYGNERELQNTSVLDEAIRTQTPEIVQNPLMRKLLLKYQGWNYEDEVRMLTSLEVCPKYFIFGDNFALKEVIIGLRSTVTKKTILNRLRGYHPPVEIRRATLSTDSFQIVAESI